MKKHSEGQKVINEYDGSGGKDNKRLVKQTRKDQDKLSKTFVEENGKEEEDIPKPSSRNKHTLGKRQSRKFSESEDEGSKSKSKFFEDLGIGKPKKKNSTMENVSNYDKKD